MRSNVQTMLRISAPAALLAVLALAGCGKLGSQNPQAQGAQQWPLVNKYCSDCHNASDLAGGLDFAKIKPENFAQHAETLEKAVRKLRGHLMPPPKEPRPDEERLSSFVSWLENSLDAVAASHGLEHWEPGTYMELKAFDNHAGGKAQITNLTQAEATRVAQQIDLGALPVQLELQSQTTVSASLSRSPCIRNRP